MANDQEYVNWLMQQDWFGTRYQSIKMIIVNNFKEPSETPEHNKLQCLFLDDNFCQRFLNNLFKVKGPDAFDEWSTNSSPYIKYLHKEYLFNSIVLEEKGVDVIINGYVIYEDRDKSNRRWLIEIKPSIGDDYPAVLRQMKTNNSTVLFIDQYTGVGATYEQLVKVFQLSGITIVKLSEL